MIPDRNRLLGTPAKITYYINENCIIFVDSNGLADRIITGWYGMNFRTMPELEAKYGYLMVILISLSVIAIELIILKKKRMI